MSVSIVWPVLTAICAFGGVLIAQAVVIWAQHDRFAGEDARRWQAERRALYAKLLGTVHNLEARVSHGIDAKDPSLIPSPYDDEAQRLETLTHEIDLIGSDAVVEATNEVSVAALLLMLEAWGPLTRQLDEQNDGDDVWTWPEIDVTEEEDRLRIARVKFARAARAELLYEPEGRRKRALKLYPGVK